MKKINLYLILAPFQLLSAVENIERTEGSEAWLIIRGTKTSRNIDQISAILDERDWDKIIYLPGNSDILAMLGLLWLKLFFILKNIKVVSLNIGEFRSKLCQWTIRIINAEKVGLLDDGVALLTFYAPQEKGIKGVEKRELLNKINPIYYNLSMQNKLILKSFLTLPNSNYWVVKKYDFNKFREKIKPSLCDTLEDEIFFLGGKFVEDNHCDLESYLKLCKLILEKFSKKKITYLPHRGESDEKILMLQKYFSFKIFRPTKPIELYLAEANKRPGSIVSFQSAVLFTIPELFPEVKVYYAKINLKAFLDPSGINGTIIKYLERINNISIMDIE